MNDPTSPLVRERVIIAVEVLLSEGLTPMGAAMFVDWALRLAEESDKGLTAKARILHVQTGELQMGPADFLAAQMKTIQQVIKPPDEPWKGEGDTG